jgi:formiminotetrahydrofolate cyclodeaminase
MRLQESTLEELLADIGRTSPPISGSTAALVAAQLGAAMAKMGLLVSGNHGFDNELAVEQLDSMIAEIKEATGRDRAASTALIDRRRTEISLLVSLTNHHRTRSRCWIRAIRYLDAPLV